MRVLYAATELQSCPGRNAEHLESSAEAAATATANSEGSQGEAAAAAQVADAVNKAIGQQQDEALTASVFIRASASTRRELIPPRVNNTIKTKRGNAGAATMFLQTLDHR